MQKFLLSFIMLLTGFAGNAQFNTEFFKSYRMSSTLWERSEGLQLLQNGYILDIGESSACTGVSTCYNSSALIWFDSFGNFVRNKKVGSSVGFYGVAALERNDGSLIIHGNCSGNALFMKTDSLGNVAWSKTVDHTEYLSGRDIVSIDSVFFVNGDMGSAGGHIYSFSESGAFRWMKSLVSAETNKIWSITRTNANTLFAISCLTRTTDYKGAACITELDRNGNVLNAKIITPSFGTYPRPTAYTICKSSDGNYIATWAYNNGTHYIMKFDASINIIWAGQITASPAFGSNYRDVITPDNEGGAWIGSHTSGPGGKIQLAHISSAGALLETNSYSNNDLIELSGMKYTADCNLLVSGARRDGVTYSHFLAALGKNGNTGCLNTAFTVSVVPVTLAAMPYTVTVNTETVTANNITMCQDAGVYQEVNYCNQAADVCAPTGLQEFSADNDILVYPSPARNELNIQYSFSKEMQFTLYNALGNVVLQKTLSGSPARLDISGYTKGLYFYRIVQGGRVSGGKVVKE